MRSSAAILVTLVAVSASAQTLGQAPDPTVKSPAAPLPVPADVVAPGPARGAVQLPEPSAVHRGHDLYQRYCQSCHGGEGNGRGDSAEFLATKPRDFAPGVFLLRSTPSGTLPTDADLFRTIRNGVWGSGMPRWAGVSDGEIWDLVAYVESFSGRFYSEARGLTVAIPTETPRTVESVAAGKQVYAESGCESCHGSRGFGDGPSVSGLRDDWGNPSRPASFAGGHWKSGTQPADLYRALMTGLDGTPMPSYAETLNPDQAWDLVHYLMTLGTKGGWRKGDSPGDKGLFDAKAP